MNKGFEEVEDLENAKLVRSTAVPRCPDNNRHGKLRETSVRVQLKLGTRLNSLEMTIHSSRISFTINGLHGPESVPKEGSS